MKYAANFREIARDALHGKWHVAILTGFVAQLIGAVLWGGGGGGSSSSSSSDDSSAINRLFYSLDPETLKVILSVLTTAGILLILWGIVLFAISGAAKLGYARFNLNLVDGKDARFSDLFSQFHRIGSGIVMNLLIGVFTSLWTLLFIIPGIIKTFSYAMTPFILAEHPEISENEAITRSRHMMNGNKWRLFCLMLSFIGWELLVSVPFAVSSIVLIAVLLSGLYSAITFAFVMCIICFIFLLIGQLFLVPYQNAALAAFYRDISTPESTGEFTA